MELMSPLLLCVLLALVPQSLGRSNFSYAYETLNEAYSKKRPKVGKNIMLNVNTIGINAKISDLQSVFMDPICKGCLKCMERVIKAHKIHNRVVNSRDYKHGGFAKQENIRYKRSSNDDKKLKKSKRNKSVSVIKYNKNGEIFALKVKETGNQLISDQRNAEKTSFTSTCQVYRVQKSFPCETPEADLILTEPKGKTNKNKKVQGKREAHVPTDKSTLIESAVRKHQNTDSSHILENFMPSIEELMY